MKGSSKSTKDIWLYLLHRTHVLFKWHLDQYKTHRRKWFCGSMKCKSWRKVCCHQTQAQFTFDVDLALNDFTKLVFFLLEYYSKLFEKRMKIFITVLLTNLYVLGNMCLTIHEICRNMMQIQHVVNLKVHSIHESKSILISTLYHENSNCRLRMKRINDSATAKLSWGGKR